MKKYPDLLLSIKNPENRRLLQKFIPDSLSVDVVIDGIGDKVFDLCIVDEQSFFINRKKLQNLKKKVAPVFLPVMLLSKDSRRSKHNQSVIEFADDVVYIPVPSQVLHSRIKLLLQQREYSLKLERKNRELEKKNKMLKKEKQKYQLITENSTDMISRHASDGTYLYATPASKQLIGFEPDELTGRLAFDFFHPDDVENIRESHTSIIGSQDTVTLSYRIKHKTQGYRWVETTSKIIRAPDSDEVIEVQSSTRDISDRKEYEMMLMQSLKEKKTLLQEIHHRVKNNLAVVSGMLELQAFNTKNKELKKLLRASEKRIKTMALIHEQLYQSDMLSKIDFGSYVKKLAKYIRDVSADDKKINLEIKHDSFKLNINQAVPCALILNEIIANSFEHAFNEKGEGSIKVSLREKGDSIFVRVKDDGKGFSDDFYDEQKKTMGFTIIHTLLNQLQADHDIDSSEGLTFSFSFEKQEIKGSSSTLV